jgi:hypothetical protein
VTDDGTAGRVAFLPQAEGIVENHPGAAEHFRQGLLLPWRGAQAVAVADQHSTTACHRPTATDGGHRRSKYFAASCGGEALSLIRQHLEQQRTPGGQPELKVARIPVTTPAWRVEALL